MTLRKLITIALMLVVACAVPADAKRKKRTSRRRAKTTKVVTKRLNLTPTSTGPMSDSEPFITYDREQPITQGLENRNIALWQSHGMYYDQGARRWRWQRPRLFGTVEDLFTQGFVMPYLMPMLENAGAYVLSPRERDISLTEIIADKEEGSPEGSLTLHNGKHKWEVADSVGGFALPKHPLVHGQNPFAMGKSWVVATVTEKDEKRESTAKWNADIPERGRYAVYVSYQSFPNSATDASYTVNHLGGSTQVTVNQRMGAGTWIYLGHFDLAEGRSKEPIVELTNVSEEKKTVVSADAVKIGGGMGNVARSPRGDTRYEPSVSGFPRYTEGARYWLQWAGMPDSVYSQTAGVNDYEDDYKSRALWVNELAGGSSMLPWRKGRNIPIDLAFAFHSDAGITSDGSVIGTLGLYSTDDGNLLGNGRSRNECGELTETVLASVVRDLRALYRPDWTDRSARDKKYYEIRETKVPAMIIELLSHQNFEDMKYGLDPAFRFDVSRAIYKGILRFLAKRYNVPYTVQPLPVKNFAITASGGGHYKLSWRQTIDSLETTSIAKYYIVEERVDDGGFRPVATVKEPHYDVQVRDHSIHSYRIVAGNEGGTSFPSEVLAFYDNGSGKPAVNIVNGFTRVSAPDTFLNGEFSGFNTLADGGVPDDVDIITTGQQYDYRSESTFVNNDRPGFGASRGNRERRVAAGNTRDFVYLHGLAVKAAGKGFVSQSVAAFIVDYPSEAPGSARNPEVVDLILGKQKEILPGNGAKGTRYKAFTPELQQRISTHTLGGGSLFVSGAYVATDLLENPFSTPEVKELDRRFANSVLGINWELSKASIDGHVSVVTSPFKVFAPERFDFNVAPSPDSYAVESPDALSPSAPEAIPIMRYDENGLCAATAMVRPVPTPADGAAASPYLCHNAVYRTVVMGFPFESILSPETRTTLMRELLTFLTTGNPEKF